MEGEQPSTSNTGTGSGSRLGSAETSDSPQELQLDPTLQCGTAVSTGGIGQSKFPDVVRSTLSNLPLNVKCGKMSPLLRNYLVIKELCEWSLFGKSDGETLQPCIPLENTMIVAFDYDGEAGSNADNMGVMVASLNNTFQKYYSIVTENKSRQEITANMSAQLLKCIKAYYRENGSLPKKIKFYRDDDGGGQVHSLHQEGLDGIQVMITKICEKFNVEMVLTFIVVTNARLFKIDNNRYEVCNPDFPDDETAVDAIMTISNS